ncbi:MAG: hypothetical protein HYT03_01240 [Candidatus Harrisonbacteria bacterium]|nr:hypothetical protein [Candidatus Harrisonbacteria bacterium]
MTRVLFVAEMAGTVNALMKPLGSSDFDVSFVANDVALSMLQKRDIVCHTFEDDPSKVIAGARPDMVLTGISAFERGNPKWSGLELKYALAAMDAGIPVAMYRDWLGIAAWAKEATQHPRAGQLLHFLTFDRGTAYAIRKAEWIYRDVRAVGSSYNEDIFQKATRIERATLRQRLGLKADDLLVVVNSGADSKRVLEILEPAVQGLLAQSSSRVVFAPTFHPKDKDAPFYVDDRKNFVARASAPYDPVLQRLSGKVRTIFEPIIRSCIQDPQERVAAADFIVMNPLSTDVPTAIFLGIPMVIPFLPLTAESARSGMIDPEKYDYILNGMADSVFTGEDLEHYMSALSDRYEEIAVRQRAEQKKLKPTADTEVIIQAIKTVATS